MVGAWKYRPEFLNTSELIINKNISNTQSIGNVIYTDYIHYFSDIWSDTFSSYDWRNFINFSKT